jgi:hypothetical protein
MLPFAGPSALEPLRPKPVRLVDSPLPLMSPGHTVVLPCSGHFAPVVSPASLGSGPLAESPASSVAGPLAEVKEAVVETPTACASCFHLSLGIWAFVPLTLASLALV